MLQSLNNNIQQLKAVNPRLGLDSTEIRLLENTNKIIGLGIRISRLEAISHFEFRKYEQFKQSAIFFCISSKYFLCFSKIEQLSTNRSSSDDL